MIHMNNHPIPFDIEPIKLSYRFKHKRLRRPLAAMKRLALKYNPIYKQKYL
jgi:hypothetical protein